MPDLVPMVFSNPSSNFLEDGELAEAGGTASVAGAGETVALPSSAAAAQRIPALGPPAPEGRELQEIQDAAAQEEPGLPAILSASSSSGPWSPASAAQPPWRTQT
eukprot:CAMPEP_0115068132 /NCGR_PEP_ID=MMETSP0227-20121206/11794_1 /TAXON_ID=89957 /ORGANISM="Polarella glacialis, Strain CCMP 1383" /LENGTH=104 /DNA_ID=CAMNT_0002454313 /DNA_START=1217 /DNA_END=1532 /DNA_ORIENTATION=-